VISDETILAAAGHLLDAKSWFAFSVRELAKQLGLAPGTIYARFGNKDELVAKVYLARIDEACAFMDSLAGDATRSMPQLLATVAPTVARLRRDFELQFERPETHESHVQAATWDELQSHFRRLTGKLHGRVCEAAAKEGIALTSGSQAERFVWAMLASCGTGRTAFAFGHRNESYYRFVAHSLLMALRSPATASAPA
jgi:AcrR family transcriptional regulator